MSEDDPYPDAPTALRPRVVQPHPLSRPFVLTVSEGPDLGKSFQIEASHPSPVLVGKSAACDVQLGDASVSRRHAALEVVSQRLRLRDLGSTNGTVVDGVTIVEALHSGGEVVRIGATAFTVDRGEPTAAVASPACRVTSPEWPTRGRAVRGVRLYSGGAQLDRVGAVRP